MPFSYGQSMDAAEQEALDEVAENGAEVVEVTLPRHVNEFMVEFMGKFPSALAHHLASEPTAPADAFDQITQEDPGAGAGAEKPDTQAYRHALNTRKSFRHALQARMDQHRLDAIAYPVYLDHGPSGRRLLRARNHPLRMRSSRRGRRTRPSPSPSGSRQTPPGIELMGRAFDEATLISIAGYKAHTDHRRLPSTTPPLDVAP